MSIGVVHPVQELDLRRIPARRLTRLANRSQCTAVCRGRAEIGRIGTETAIVLLCYPLVQAPFKPSLVLRATSITYGLVMASAALDARAVVSNVVCASFWSRSLAASCI